MGTLKENLTEIKRQKDTYLLPENLKQGVTCLGITGTLSPGSETGGGVKLFATVDEMNADPNPQEGDLAIVYKSEIQNATVASQFQIATFPDTVVLDSAITDYIEFRYRAVDGSMFDCMGSLNSSNFRMDCRTERGRIRIQYTSSDGITYTRTDTTGNPVDFGTEIYYERTDRWNDAIGKFIQVSRTHFEGLYKYSNSNWILAPTQLNAISEYVYGKEFYGKNGVEIGTLQNKENLTKDEVKHRVDIWSNYNSGIICPDDVSEMFYGYTNLTTIPLLDTSGVTTMYAMFQGCTNLTTIPLLNTSNVTNMRSMFQGCTNLTTIPSLDTSNVTYMRDVFNGCINLTEIPLLNTSNVTNMYQMFYKCTNLTTIPLLNTSSVTDMGQMFYSCKNLATIPQLNTSSVTDMGGMFSNCSKLTTIPLLDTSSVTDMEAMFYGCTNLTEIPQLDTSNTTNMGAMFESCINLTEIPLLDTSRVTYINAMFNGCTNLTTIPQLDTSNVIDMTFMFRSCTNLTTIPLLNTSKVTNMRNMFGGCTNLSDESLNNILAMCKNATSYTDTKTLAWIGLTSEQATKCTTLSNYSAFTAAGWTTGY